MFWLLPMLANALGAGATGAAGKAATTAVSTIGKAALPSVAESTSPMAKLGQAAMGKINPVITDFQNNINDFSPNGIPGGNKIGDIIQTAQDVHALKGNNQPMQPTQTPDFSSMQMPNVDPDKHLNPPNDMGIRTFNDAGTQMLNDHIQPQRFNGYQPIGRTNNSNN